MRFSIDELLFGLEKNPADWLQGEKDLKAFAEKDGRGLASLRMAYEGGEEATRHFVFQKRGEDPDSYLERLRRVVNMPVVKPVVDVVADLLYMQQPEREVWVGDRPKSRSQLAYEWLEWYRDGEPVGQEPSGKSEESEVLQNLFDEMVRGIPYLTWLKLARLEGRSAMKTYPVTRGGEGDILCAKAHVVDKRENAIPLFKPSDQSTIVGVLEKESNDSDSFIIYTLEDDDLVHLTRINPDLSAKEVDTWPIRYLPFVFLGDGVSVANDAWVQQRDLINALSLETNIRTKQGHAIPVITGDIDTPAGSGGEMRIGGDRWLKMLQGGDFKYVNPAAPLVEHRAAIQERMAAAMKAGKVPSDWFKDTMGVEQPMSKKLSWTATLIEAACSKNLVVPAEKQLANVLLDWLSLDSVLDYYEEDGFDVVGFDPNDVEVEIKFRKDLLPTDKKAEEEKDRANVQSGLMLITEWMARHMSSEYSAQQIGLEAFRIEEEKSRKQEAFQRNLEPGQPPNLSMIVGDDDEDDEDDERATN